MIRYFGLAGLLMLLLNTAGCYPSELVLSPTLAAAPVTPTPPPPLEVQLREAFRQPDPDLRRDQVLSAVDAFLRDDAIRQTDDAIATSYFNDIAFSSGRLTLPDPAIIQRQDNRAIVLLPEGMGLYLFDVSLDGAVVELSRWTIGLSDIQVFWREAEVGVKYTTVGRDDVTRPHFVLALQEEAGWRLAWASDEMVDWWFNAAGGALRVADDLSELRLVGEAGGTTTDFFEQPGEPRRQFAIVWIWQEDGYVMYPPLADYEDRSAWFRAAAVPSPYATLVAFIEYLGAGNRQGAAGLTSGADVLQAVSDFGLDDPNRRYQVVTYEKDRILFRDVQGAFVATFDPPASSGQPWLINQLTPVGAAVPEPAETEESPSP